MLMKKILLTLLLVTSFSLGSVFDDYKKACDSGNGSGCTILAISYFNS